MISEKSIQEVLETVKVEDVIQDYVNLKRRGVNMIGLCPFHNEKTPSFTVSPSKNIYKCFGCGVGGNAVQFLMEHEQLSFPEAIRHLAKKYGIELEETQVSTEYMEERQKMESLYIVNQFAKTYYQEQLFDTDRGKSVGLSYFKKRGFREDIIRKFGLGYAPEKKDSFTLSATQQGYSVDLLKKLGLTSEYGRDFFRDRVMFAIHNLSGKVIGFGGRILVNGVKAPKYINSPETEIYNKSKVLYGAYFAKKAIRQQDECIMVEGYTDVISLHQEGIENVVASSGTSLTVGQIQLVKRNTQNLKILYDGDFAGVKAALRGLDLVLEQDMNVKVVLLPEGEDPDSYLQKVGADIFKIYLEQNAQDFILFKVNVLLKDAANDPIKKTEVIRDIVGSIAKIPDPIKRSLYIRECSKVMEVEEQLLVQETNKMVGRQFKKTLKDQELEQQPDPKVLLPSEQGIEAIVPKAKKPNVIRQTDEFQEKDIARILVVAGDFIFDKSENLTVAEYILPNLSDVINDFENTTYKKIVEECRSILSQGRKVNLQHFINHTDADLQKIAVDFSSSPYEYSENWEKRWDVFLQTQKMPDENFQNDSLQALKRFRLKKIMRLIDKNHQKIKQLNKPEDFEQAMLYMKVQRKLEGLRDELAKQLGTVILK